MSYLESLNPAQKRAVCHTDGPLLVLAGAGAGKTRVITYRILHLIRHGIAPEHILAVTFTNKAAREMRERIGELLRNDADLNRPVSMRTAPFVATFHSLGVHILRENARLLGIARHFAIYDRADSLRAVKDAIVSAGYDPKHFEPRKILGLISKMKGRGIARDAFATRASNDYISSVAAEVWERYEKTLAKDNALDFDDLLLRAVALLRDNADIRARYEQTWQYIHIDEYQDTNGVQYEFTQLLCGNHQNICAVGDADQNIYSWRGANIDNILNFEKDYKGASVVLLEENYRSTKTILGAAGDIIKKNTKRKDKELFTRNDDGDKITVYAAYDEADEARFVAESIRDIQAAVPDEKAPSIAVLYRANFQSRALEEACMYAGIAYQVLGTKFFDRKEVKDVLSYLRAALNPDCTADLKRVINTPTRGIGKVTLLKIIEGKQDQLTPAIKKRVDAFFELLKEIKTAIETQKPSEAVKTAVRASGLEDSLKRGGDEEMERLENIRELATLARKYDASAAGGESTAGIESLLEEAALATDQDALADSSTGGGETVKLMTVHAAKGLEFDYVFVTGMEEGLFPHEGMVDEDRDEEEERRLFYVALTRARKKVFLTFTSIRTIFGAQQVNVPSQFLTDIDEAHIETSEEATPARTIYLDD